MPSLQTDGYTIINDPDALPLIDTLSEQIRQLVGTTNGQLVGLLLGRHPVFEQAALLPSLLKVAEETLGPAFTLSQMVGSVKDRGTPAVPLHCDAAWFPDPQPVWDIALTACWALTDFTLAGGCTSVVPRSHHQRCFPRPEAAADLVPIECPRGSIILWNGRVWHASYPRTEPGQRVALHTSYARFGFAPLERYDHLDPVSDAVTSLLGRGSFLGSTTLTSPGIDGRLFIEAVSRTHGRPVV
jgi:hypothetical protein